MGGMNGGLKVAKCKYAGCQITGYDYYDYRGHNGYVHKRT